ncbi:helix-turn-helix domain-containing protein [Lacticaseibacillus chiayiensis]|uniref:helix-turn-helix domain-containing protein n=1 Tax=Lacticaseibacillus chiayiensis TaxID=2100821 RepID=UPI001011151C|nr:helix-turn-helix domain-containing protein [Lacticaseibacillus chiayiensis]QVI34550.1 helix-turn-helix domain-containing protein [Lacticaseibacillus chiayiensis]RXT54391.1 transposase [Lacticaseibacillus chiayiensis]
MPRSKYTVIEKLQILEEFKTTKQGIRAFAQAHGLSAGTVRKWQSRYERDGLEGLKEPRTNKHYSKGFKLRVVLAYLNGEGSMFELTKRFGLRAHTQLSDWVAMYNRDHQSLTASPSRKQVPTMSRKTTFKERIEVVDYVTKGKHSYTEAAAHFDVSYQQARSWVIKAREGGYEALVDNRGHRKEKRDLTELDKAKLRIRQLEAELKDKELVEAFIKKLQEIQRKG